MLRELCPHVFDDSLKKLQRTLRLGFILKDSVQFREHHSKALPRPSSTGLTERSKGQADVISHLMTQTQIKQALAISKDGDHIRAMQFYEIGD
ncbi:hypothetical protein AXXA_16507 [Achromobacter insuavis AXX-A]|uniref:Uncharacterized protein n=1 Tax=Achromobacter insuavis AXX-A TaxID=1003200 RepID=F7T2Y7_9BURK|nr:hypothetical protein AXXA_16507 [Achromobacter insuavis AXX-A]